MKIVYCSACKNAYQVGGEAEEVKSLLGSTENFPCITPLCSGRLNIWHPRDGLPPDHKVHEVPVRSFFRAIHGFGLSKGAPASFERAQELLLKKRIVQVKGEPVGQPERVILRELVLEDGTRLHFEASSRGACLYFIEEVGPSCVEVFDETTSDDGQGSGAGTAKNREEGGRALEALTDARISSGSGGVSNDAAPERPEPRSVSAVPEASGLHTGEPGISRGSGSDSGQAVRVHSSDQPTTS